MLIDNIENDGWFFAAERFSLITNPINMTRLKLEL